MLAALVLIAQAAETKAAEGPPPLFQMLPILLIFGALWLLVILPAQRKEKKQRESISGALKKNDEVLTTGGMIGVVQNVREGEDEVTIKVDDNCKIRFKKSAIAQILKAKDDPAAPAKS